jgi:glycosyltransferase involved in cell wall biosynthesis
MDSLSADADRFDLTEAARILGRHACARLGLYQFPPGFLLSVVIPVHNERRTIETVVARVRAAGVPSELILVDDCSKDGTRELLESWAPSPDLRVIFHERNRGKGAALRTGFAAARGQVVVIQDADLEYDPAEFRQLLQPIVDGRADAVFGSRFTGESQRVLYFWHYLGNKFLTLLSNAMTNLNLTDMETCYKLFRREALEQLLPQLRENRFGIEPELTAKLASIPGIRIFEVPITYSGRTYAEGKHITWRDGFRALWCILRYRRGLRRPAPLPPTPWTLS